MNKPKPVAAEAASLRPAHPAADLFPLMDNADLQSLIDDIRRHGLKHPIILHADGSILDGRNRAAACFRLGVLPRHETWKGQPGEEIAYVLSANLHRRHLDDGQRAEIGARIANLRQGEHPNLKQANMPVTQKQAARLLNVSERLVRDAARIIREAPPEIIRKIQLGELAVSRAAADLRRARPAPAPKPAAEPAPAAKAPPEAKPAAEAPPQCIGWRTGRPVAELAREAARRREAGETMKAIGLDLHISPTPAALIADVALLADRRDLGARHAALARQAWQAMLAGAGENDLQAMIAPLARRLWGIERRSVRPERGLLERRRQKDFDITLAVIRGACCARIEVPALPAARAADIVREWEGMIASLKATLALIKESTA